MTSQNKTSRIAGSLYLGVVVTGLFSLMYVPSQLIVDNNASLTFRNISSSELLFRSGIVGGLLCYTIFLFLPLVLHKLLSPVNKNMAKLMVLLGVISVPMYYINVQNELTVLSIMNNEGLHKVFSNEQMQAQILFYLNRYDDGMRLIHIFSGLWLFPFGYLVFKSNFLPKFLGLFLMFGCLGYLTNFLGYVVIRNYSELGISSYIAMPASLGEIGICFWLLLKGTTKIKPALS